MTPIVALHDPTALTWHFLLLELTVLTWAGLTLRHALRAHRRGDRAALLTWVTILTYGVAMEGVSYTAVDNFAHGQFTVMFLGGKLPLYITAVYPVLLYTGIAVARALRLRPAAEAITAGALIVALDVPYDLAGPRAGWWRWFDTDPNIAYRWGGVPVTSFYWHLAFGAVLAALTAFAARRARRPPPLWWAFPLATLTIVLGVLAFTPFHGLAALGVSHGVIVGGSLAGAALVALGAFTLRRPADKLAGRGQPA